MWEHNLNHRIQLRPPSTSSRKILCLDAPRQILRMKTTSRKKAPTLPILTRSQHRQFIQEQRTIIRTLIRDFSLEREVFYTFFATPKIVHKDALEDILVFKEVIYEIIFDQRGTDFLFYIWNLPKGAFTHLRGEQDDKPEGPPQYDSDGNEIYTNEESD